MRHAKRTRTRFYEYPSLSASCGLNLTEFQTCFEETRECPGAARHAMEL